MVVKIVCLGDPVVDILAKVESDSLRALNVIEGGCVTLSSSEFEDFLTSIKPSEPLQRTGGGSAANVAKGLANLLEANGHVTFAGRLGSDEIGGQYAKEIQAENIHPALCRADDEATAACLCLVTPDGQRTMRTCLAAASGLHSVDQLPTGWVQGCNLLHMEGYVLYRPGLAREAVQSAKAEGAMVSLDLSSFELVQHCRQALLELLQAGSVDIIVCNEEEARAVTQGLSHASTSVEDSIQTAQTYLLQFCQVSVVSLGAKGCLVQGKMQPQTRCAAPSTPVIDTVGAGDYFTAGFLYGFMLGQTLQVCSEVGCCVGSMSVHHRGAALSSAAWRQVQTDIKSLLK